jgi:hypothetical protein
VDWSRRADYILASTRCIRTGRPRRCVTSTPVWLVPDPASRSGYAVRVIGYASTPAAVLTVILVDAEADPTDRPDGDWWRSNAWMANRWDRDLYGRRDHEQD